MRHKIICWVAFPLLCLIVSVIPGMAKGDPEIQMVQERLKADGFAPGSIDGILGQKTISALRRYQKAHGLKETGLLDQATRKFLGLDMSKVRSTNTSDTFVIPIEIENSKRVTKTRGEIKIVEGNPKIIGFSVDCDGCMAEMPLSTTLSSG